MRFSHVLCLIAAVVILAVGAEFALADCQTTGFQQQLVLSASRPTSIGSATFTGQKMWTAESKGECTFAHLGLKNSIALGATNVSIEPILGYVGGWYKSSDGVSVGSKFGAKQGPVALNLSFEWFSDTGEADWGRHTKFWMHTVGYKVGSFTVGGLFNKVDRLEKTGPYVAYKGGDHWTVEGRWYRSLNRDPKLGSHVENGRLILKIS
ncbi:MAG: hypothetical protein V1778_01695 [bacterium]